jgi:hypothetical protein
MKSLGILRSLLVAALVVFAVLVAVPSSEAASVVVRRGIGFRQRVVVRQPQAVVVGPRRAAAIIAPQAVVVPGFAPHALIVPQQQVIVPSRQLLIVR